MRFCFLFLLLLSLWETVTRIPTLSDHSEKPLGISTIAGNGAEGSSGDGGTLTVFYSRIGDKPERILMSKIELTPDWKSWQATEPVTVLAPELDYEGAALPLEDSKSGDAPGRVRQLRDPAIFREGGRTYLLYSVAGESGIAIAELK
jgi:hypothetical protein